MDIFGIGQAIKSVAMVYIQTSRRTGRTTAMIENVKDGDRIIFSNSAEAERVERLLRERGIKDVMCGTISCKRITDKLGPLGRSRGRTMFDHSWVEDYYMNAIEHCEKDIDFFQEMLSDKKEPPVMSKRTVSEMSKWHID